jgi:hypothetical protein
MVCIVYALQSQSVHTLIGSRAQGLAYASACLEDEWSVFNNVAGLATLKQTTAGFSYVAHPSLKSFNRMAAVFVAPVPLGTAAAGIYRFGDDLYSEQLLTAAYANTFGLASLGVKVQYVQYRAEGYGTAGKVSVSFGGIAHITPTLAVGAHITNVTQPEISKEDQERLPVVLAAGVSFTPSDKLFVAAEIEKDLDYAFTWKAAFEYHPLKKFVFRSGFNIRPDAGFIGVGFVPTRYKIDYALRYQPGFGISHQATVVYPFKHREK